MHLRWVGQYGPNVIGLLINVISRSDTCYYVIWVIVGPVVT
jgi:hypothetical protein